MAPTPRSTTERSAGTRQIGAGVALLLVGAVVAFLLVRGGVDTLASFGYVLLAAGVALVVNGLLLRRKSSRQPR